ncbi:hypothetical protein [Bradyrhizobium japonicum]|uniref:hypothetical protein n=1 Tax=Bradyrhizobium japonicum TaxID=375 RepID=UPI001364C60B|nr:hypothetical protein [Bradyrhizobium japonicum]
MILDWHEPNGFALIALYLYFLPEVLSFYWPLTLSAVSLVVAFVFARTNCGDQT